MASITRFFSKYVLVIETIKGKHLTRRGSIRVTGIIAMANMKTRRNGNITGIL